MTQHTPPCEDGCSGYLYDEEALECDCRCHSSPTAQHTPGPWNWQEWEDGTRAIEASDGGPDVISRQTGILAEDARLIAAAPELLEACEEIVKHATRYGASPLSASKMFDRCRAAIAKATGG